MEQKERGNYTPTMPKSPDHDTEKNGGTANNRGNWSNKWEFVLSCLGYSVGYGNIWRFPYLCYKNGGAAFLIPYYILTICAALPLSLTEVGIGQYTSHGPIALFNNLAPLFSGLGWGLMMMCAVTAIYYNIIVAWSFFYIFASFTDFLPWADCNNDFNSPECFSNADAALCMNETNYYFDGSCLSVDEYCDVADLIMYNLTHCHHPVDGPVLADSVLPKVSPSEDYFKNRMLGVRGKSWNNMGGLRWEIVGCLALGWVIVALSLIKGIKSLGKVVYFTSTFPYIILAILFARGITLDGAYQGLEFYILKPNISRLAEAEVWSDAAVQIFYSNCIAFGTLITLSSYNKFNNNCMRDSTVVCFMNSSTSVFSGLVIFSVLGFLAKELGVRVDEVASSGSGLIFVVYPAALALLPVPQLWSVLFFLMVVDLGIGTQISSVETLTSALYDRFEFLRPKKALVSFAMCFVLFLLGLTMCLEGGILMFELFFWYSAGLGLIVLAFTQLIGIHFFYGYKRFLSNLTEMGVHMPRVVRYYWTVTWIVTAPLLIISIGFFYIYNFVPAYWGDYVFPTEIQVLGGFLSFASMGCIPIGMAVAFCRTKKCSDMVKISEDFCPASARREWKYIEEDEEITRTCSTQFTPTEEVRVPGNDCLEMDPQP